ncbi:MAG: ATP-dependent protease subunit HslV [Clostridiales bacterium]|nr:ATP-dependent protease subunit HslV [Clostridiales bacterium]
MEIKATTIIGVKRDGKTVIAGDGQATLGEHIIFKANSHKVKRIYNDKVIVGFAGRPTEGFTMCEEFEKMLNKYSGSLLRSAVEFSKNVRSSGGGGESMMIVADHDNMYVITSQGDVLEPDDGICGIGSGGTYALSAGRALLYNTDLDARTIAHKSLDIASDICVYTNKNFVFEEV